MLMMTAATAPMPVMPTAREAVSGIFKALENAFANLVFDLRKASFQEIEDAFAHTKQSIESLLNALQPDLARVTGDFNRVCHRIKSADNKYFDVMAKVNRMGKIQLLFVEA